MQVKLLTLLSGFFIWFFVVTANEYSFELRAALHLENMPENHVLARPVPEHIRILYRGAGRDLLHLLIRDRVLRLNLNHNTESLWYTVQTNMLDAVPAHMNLNPARIVSQDSVFIALDVYSEKKVPVRSQLKLAMMDGYIQVGETRFHPDSVIVKGARQLVESVDEIFTKEDQYQHLLKDLTRTAQLVRPEDDMITLSHSNVNFSVNVQRIGERMIDGIPIHVTNLPASVKDAIVIPSTLSLVVHGGNEFLMNLKKDDISATIDYRSLVYDLRTGGPIRQVRAAIDLPEDIIYYNAKPQSFDIILER